ncbi:MAG: ribose 1,5-bisphosphate isomerase [Euryarchaeota archaeon]|nr:ribose 1,5-bisphosphate isomerase [Euryarchaeota archaeon]
MPIEAVLDTAQKISSMEIRGAGKIGRAAAAALKAAAEKSKARDANALLTELEEAGRILIAARPTAVSLPNAVRFVLSRLRAATSQEVGELRKAAVEAAGEFVQNSLSAVERIGEIGAKRFSDGDVVLTHCNSMAVNAVLRTAWRSGKRFEVYVTESRPRYQGHITARQLAEEGIPVTMIVDSAVRYIMKDVDKVIVGADSIAANGAAVNKIGTAQIALIAREARALFFVAAESYKFHPETLLGSLVEIEERDAREVADPGEFEGVKIRNPAFDVTPPEYIDLIITEKGIIPPQAAIMVIREEFGWALSSNRR